ncbi:MAG: NAD-dependent deacylase [Bacteroidetes bacterium]|nr:NAD-dependent deacylase [Bacteroidota bacterium]
MKKIVVLTGAGISAESGLKTFRDSDGLWENYRIEDVATPSAWEKNPSLVVEFYNIRRQQALKAKPNAAHSALVKLEKKYDVQIITQNIDDLHERAGSKNVLHLHGEIMKCRSSKDSDLVFPTKNDGLKMGDICPKGSQLRPHVVWFGEMVPELPHAAEFTSQADILIVVGTSLVVYPAAGLLDMAPHPIRKYYIDPNAQPRNNINNLHIIAEKATKGVPELVEKLLEK